MFGCSNVVGNLPLVREKHTESVFNTAHCVSIVPQAVYKARRGLGGRGPANYLRVPPHLAFYGPHEHFHEAGAHGRPVQPKTLSRLDLC